MIKALFNLFLLVGSEWVLWILAACSLLSLAVIFERSRKLGVQERIGRKLWKTHLAPWIDQGVPEHWEARAFDLSKQYSCVESRLLQTFAKSSKNGTSKGTPDIHGLSQSFLISERMELERYLAILGTLGNSAPFIGLFGTVLGIIRAFAELNSATGNTGLNTVSGGLAEALVTTATGLLVAIPSAIAFNYYQRSIKAIVSRSMSLTELVSSHLRNQ